MDFESAKSLAQEWVNTNGTAWKISADESERKLTFTFPAKDLSFYVICPSQSDKWQVWSETEAVHPFLQEIIEYADSSRDKSLTDILKYAAKSLKPLLGGEESEEEEEEEEENEEDDDDMGGAYYMEEDEDAEKEIVAKEENSDAEDENFFMAQGNPAAIKRLLSDYKNLQKSAGKFGIHAQPRNDNLFVWDVKLTDIPPDSPLGKDLADYAKKNKREPVIDMEMQFPGDYPMKPPFVRVVRPRFKFLTGHVTIGGSICMEMLTNSGWRPVNDIESILVQVRSEIMSDKNARLDSNPDRAYGEQEARDAFIRMVQRYGWNK